MNVLEHLETRKGSRAEPFSFTIVIDENPVQIYAQHPNVEEEAKIKADDNLIDQMLNEIIFRSRDKDGKLIFNPYEKYKYRKMFDPNLLNEWYLKIKRPFGVEEKVWQDHINDMLKTFGV